MTASEIQLLKEFFIIDCVVLGTVALLGSMAFFWPKAIYYLKGETTDE